ncbi:MAG: metal ABC transporter substrate-binding protein [Phycisphaerales bacterium]
MKTVNSTDTVSFLRNLAASIVALALFVLPACSDDSDDAAAVDRDSVVVTIFPIFDLTERIAGDAVEVRLLLSPGLSPHSYSASPADANALNEARLLIANGGGIDDWIAQPWRRRHEDGLALVHLSSLVGGPLGEFDLEAAHDDHDHDHADAHGHEHDHGPFNPHRWLVPRDAERYVDAIEAALIEAFPDHAAGFRERAEALRREIEAVDAEYASRLTGFEDRRIVTFHDAFTPLAEAYGVEVAASIFSIESRQVSPAVLQRVSQQIENEGVRAVYIEPQFNPEAAQRLGELVTLRTLDPIGDPGRPGYDSWMALMRSNLDALVEGLRENDSSGAADPADTGDTDG